MAFVLQESKLKWEDSLEEREGVNLQCKQVCETQRGWVVR